jgi:hypothetical protein
MEIKAKSLTESPLIGIIGATVPTNPYYSSQGFNIGYTIREFLQRSPGKVFTGGVEGIGIDAYAGVVKYCVDEGIKTGKIPEDKFFVIIPDNVEYLDWATNKKIQTPFFPPETYDLLARFLPRGNLDIIRSGKNMYERRLGLASLADILVVVNGGPGTDHEAYIGLELGKKVIACTPTGGTAKLLESVKNGNYCPQKPKKMKGFLQDVFSEENLGKNLTPEPPRFESINPNLISLVDSQERLIEELRKLSK